MGNWGFLSIRQWIAPRTMAGGGVCSLLSDCKFPGPWLTPRPGASAGLLSRGSSDVLRSPDCRSCPVHPGLYPLNTRSSPPSRDNQNCLLTLPNVPWDKIVPPLRATALEGEAYLRRSGIEIPRQGGRGPLSLCLGPALAISSLLMSMLFGSHSFGSFFPRFGPVV